MMRIDISTLRMLKHLISKIETKLPKTDRRLIEIQIADIIQRINRQF